MGMEIKQIFEKFTTFNFASSLEKSTYEQINAFRLSLLKTWGNLSMSISQNDKDIKNKQVQQTIVTSGDISQCNRLQSLKSSHENVMSFHNDENIFDAQNLTPNLTPGDRFGEINEQISGNSVESESSTRRKSMGEVNIGNRISYFESN